jgi:hypothetical protein
VPENVIISYRGANYAIGQGQLYYGIWPAAAPQGQPLEWWQHTPEGWSAAWARFTSLEVPGTIGPVSGPVSAMAPAPQAAAAFAAPSYAGQPAAGPATAIQANMAQATGPAPAGPAGAALAGAALAGAGTGPAEAGSARATRNSRIGAGLLALGVVLGIAGLFPVYLGGTSLSSQAAEAVPHAIYLAAWTLSAALILLGGSRRRVGALLALGTTVVTFGLFLADVGTPIAGGSHLMGAGLIVSCIGWVACAAGTVLALRAGLSVREALALRGSAAARVVPNGYGSRPSQPRRFASHEIVPMVTLILAAIGAAIAFAPSWDSFTLQTSVTGAQTITEGNAFSNPGPVIASDLIVMLAFVAVIVVAAMWRPIRLGAALAAGAAIPFIAQAISAIVQVQTKATPGQFGISQSQASAIGLTIHSGLTPMFWVFCAFLGTLILLGIWMILAPVHEAAGQFAGHPQAAYWYQPSGAGQGAAVGAGNAGAAEAAAAGNDAAGGADVSGRTAGSGGPSGEAPVVTGVQPAPQQ